jgi:hypothetical protein
VSNDGEIGVVSKRHDELVYHESKDSELGGTSVVQLQSTLLELLLVGEGVPSKVDASVTEVTNELVSGSGDSRMKAHSRTPTAPTIWTSPAVGMESGPKRAATPLG